MSMDDAPFVINSSMKINHVHLKVSNLSESLNFYKSILGFKILKEDVPLQKPEHATLKSVFIELTKKKNIWNYIS